MKLKEIKSYIAICCTNIEQVRELDKKMKSGRCFEAFLSFPCYILTDGKKYYGCVQDKNFISSENYNPVPQIVNFSDLIIPEMSAEEMLSILNEIRSCCGRDCNKCPISDSNNGNYGYCSGNYGIRVSDKNGLLEICQKWKSDHEKKEPEIETVDICRIIEIQPDGRKRCVHEEDIDLPFGGYEKQRVEEILKCYCMEHDGEYIAVHEVVSRVKAVE